VLNGHIHTTSYINKVLTVGSFERLRHGEEESKGFYIISLKDKYQVGIKFVKNREAVPFITLDISGYDDKTLITSIENFIEKRFNGVNGYLRLRYDLGIDINAIITYLRNIYNNVNITTDLKKDHNRSNTSIEIKSIKTRVIDKTSIVGLVEDKMVRMGISNDESIGILKELV
jgi:hypothetical protein